MSEEERYIHYTVQEAPVAGYTPGEPSETATSYQVIPDSGSIDGNIERVTTCTELDISLKAETDLAFVAIKKSAKRHLIWTPRAISGPEKIMLMNKINVVSGFKGEMNNSTVEFISGLPLETEFFKGTVTTSKKSDKQMHVEFANHETWAQLCYGSYQYTYDPGTTEFTNSMNTTEVDAVKAWQDSAGQTMTPVAGTSVTFDLFANGEQQNRPIVLNGLIDVSALSEDPDIAKTQEVKADAIEADMYEKEAWKAYWGGLPTQDAEGNSIVYTVKETEVPEGYKNLNQDGIAPGETIVNKQTVIDIHILKVDEQTPANPITGAKFRLDQYDSERKAVIKTWPESEVSNEVGKEGTLSFSGLGVGKYTLVETKSPTGYVKASKNPEFEVIENDGELLVQFTDTTGKITYDPANKTFTVINEPGAALPHTGGPGTTLFYLIGLLLTAIACTGVLSRRRSR